MKPFLAALALISAPLINNAAHAEWRRFHDPELGVALDFPAHIFRQLSDARQGRGLAYSTPDGRARVRIFSFVRQPGETPARHLRRIADTRTARFTYVKTAPSFFAASGLINGEIFYRRCNFPRSDRRVSCVEFFYPETDKRAWDGVVTRMSQSLRTLG